MCTDDPMLRRRIYLHPSIEPEYSSVREKQEAVCFSTLDATLIAPFFTILSNGGCEQKTEPTKAQIPMKTQGGGL